MLLPKIILHTSHLASATVNCLNQGNVGLSNSCDTGLPTVNANSGAISTVLQYTFGIIGALALIIILVAAIQFVTSSGDPQTTKKARETLIYAAVGLLVALLAEALVTFVLTNI